LPPWDAVIEQLPAETKAIVLPATVQTPVELDAKLIGRLELALAVSAGGALVNAVLAGWLKLIVLTPDVTLNVCVTGVAAVKLALPACEAVIEQVPTDTNEIALPETVQTPVELEAKLTGRLELALADSVGGALLKEVFEGCVKSIVCDCCPPLAWYVNVKTLPYVPCTSSSSVNFGCS
jgi:hypothetical protein